MFRSRGIVCLILLILACSCTSSPPAEPVAMIFEVNERLLASPVELPEAALSLRPPAGWVRHEIGSGSPANPRPLVSYADSSMSSFLFLSLWETGNDGGGKSFRDLVTRQLVEQHGEALRHEDYLLRGRPVRQILIEDSSMTVFKVLFGAGGQLDLIVPRHQAPRQLDLIESVLGSIEWMEPANKEEP